MNKKYFFLLVLLLVAVAPVMAQDDDEALSKDEQIFRFVYVAPDNTMTQQRLLADLEDYRNHVVSEGSPAIFYLAAGQDPVIVKFNLGDDNSEDFDSQLMGYLRQSMSTNVEAGYDRQRILELFTRYNFLNEGGQIAYKQVQLNFHAGKTFWNSGNNETVIGALFFELNAAKFIGDENGEKMQFNVFFRCPPSRGDFDHEKPFGYINLDGINDKVIPQTKD